MKLGSISSFLRFLPANFRNSISPFLRFLPADFRNSVTSRHFSTQTSHFNALLTRHLRSNDPFSAVLLFHQMHSTSIPLDSFSFPPILSACSSLLLPSLGRQVHALLSKSLPFITSPIPLTSLLDFYSKNHSLSDARKLFDEMPTRDSVAFNSLISSLIRHNCPADAIRMFHLMVTDGIPITDFTLCSLLKACETLRTLRQGKQIHARVVVSDWCSIVMATALVDFYSGCGAVRDALEVFDGFDCAKDVRIYNSLINGLVLNGWYDEAFSILKKMKPGEIALTCALNACAATLNLGYGKEMHCVIVRRGFDRETISCNAVLDMYAKCGEIAIARLVFDRIVEKNVVSWTSIIDAYGSHGLGTKALKLFKEFEEEGEPNAVTFLSILSACGHSGLVDEGRRCFLSMKDKYGIHPDPEHYACYIDMLGRAKRIEEAWDVFCSVEKLTSGVCVAMLNACRVSMDMVRGELVVRRLRELDPKNPGSYVLISNFYADVGRWKGVEDSREAMKGRGLRKEVGSSQIAV